MKIRLVITVFLACLCLSPLWLSQGDARADDGESLRQVQTALDKNDYDEAVRLLKPLVDSGNAEALYVMGRLILDGKGVKKNRTRAAEFFRLAAEKGDVSAMNSWATALASGDG
ncbi:tetratricopeptide repeat protein, partial [Desulfovibrio sp. 1214_IL3152]